MNSYATIFQPGRSIGKVARTLVIVYMLSGGRDVSTEFYLSSFSEHFNAFFKIRENDMNKWANQNGHKGNSKIQTHTIIVFRLLTVK